MSGRTCVNALDPVECGLTRGRPFKKGNTAGRGRPEGSRNKATLLFDELADDEAETIQQQVIAAAKGGDLKAAELVLARIWSPRRGRPIRLELPLLRSPRTYPTAWPWGRRHGRRRGHARGGSEQPSLSGAASMA